MTEIFKPTGFRPLRDEQWEMKQAVIARDGITDCFWCRRPFLSEDDATLEHINPLADGGRHDLRNCTLACYECNVRNEPRTRRDTRELHAKRKAEIKAINRALNGGDSVEDCDEFVSSRFEAIARGYVRSKFTYAEASFYLKNIHCQLGRNPPTAHEKHVFKSHFNRWLQTHRIRRNGDSKTI